MGDHEDQWAIAARIANALKDGHLDYVIQNAPRAIRSTSDAEVHANIFGCLGSAYQQKGQWHDSIQCLSRSLKLNPDLKWARTARGASFMRGGEPAKGIRDANHVLETDPDSVALYVRGGCWLLLAVSADNPRKQFYLRRAIVDVDEAVHLDPKCEDYQRTQSLLHGIAPPSEPVWSSDGWDLAEKIARVAGKFLGGALS